MRLRAIVRAAFDHCYLVTIRDTQVEQEGTGLQQLADRGLATAEQQAILAGHKATGAAQVGASAQPSG